MNTISAETLIQNHISNLAELLSEIIKQKNEVLKNMKIEMENLDKLKKLKINEKINLKTVYTEYGRHYEIINMKGK